jgi:hypothetical protein
LKFLKGSVRVVTTFDAPDFFVVLTDRALFRGARLFFFVAMTLTLDRYDREDGFAMERG